MKKLLILFLLILLLDTSIIAQFQQKPMLGEQINWAHPLSRGLVGCWPMLAGAGDKVYDLSGNGNTGTFSGDMSWGGGQFGPCLTGGGTNSYVSVPHFAFVDYSYSLWFRTSHDHSGGVKTILSKWINLWLVFGTDNKVRAYTNDGNYQSVASLSTLNDGEWHHAVVTLEKDGNIELFIDGISQGTDTLGTPDVNTNPFYIGCRQGNQAYFLGDIDHVMVFDRALSASEIAQLCREPFCMFERAFNPLIYGGVTGAPPEPSGQVIIISMASMPLFIVFLSFCFKMDSWKDERRNRTRLSGRV